MSSNDNFLERTSIIALSDECYDLLKIANKGIYLYGSVLRHNLHPRLAYN